MEDDLVEKRVIEACAHAAHETNRAYCEAHKDHSQAPWDDAPEDIRESARAGVKLALNPETSPESQHDAWCDFKRSAGWAYGETKDAEAKTHPCLVSYGDLPEEQRRKDALYQTAVRSMASSIG